MDKKCSYICDTNGVRASKKVNGRTTEFNVLGSKILAQNSIYGEMYFQYSGDELIGFCLDDAQYFYIKNPNGDIVGITDYDGNLIAEYEYDEWGKLLNIITAEEGNEEQLKIANANPFRYRGYYYDNETGYYYLHSRYYNPEWGRFISADDFNYINNTRLTRNAYIYCINNPIKYSDSTGYDFTWDTLFGIIEGIFTAYSDWLSEQLKSNRLFAALQGLVYAIQLDALIDAFKSTFNFDLVKFYEQLLNKGNELLIKDFEKLTQFFITGFNVIWSNIMDFDPFSSAKDILFTVLDIFNIDIIIDVPISIIDIAKNFVYGFLDNGFYFSDIESALISGSKLIVDLLSMGLGPWSGLIVPPAIDVLIDTIALMCKGLISPIG